MFAAGAADVADLSGNWWLNPKRSRWSDKGRPPNNVALIIEHHEPELKYHGTINRLELEPIKFEFNGRIDGKEYTATEDGVPRKMTFKRRSDRVIESVSELPGGKGKETSVITISADGKTLERRMKIKDSAGGEREWVEIYEKRP